LFLLQKLNYNPVINGPGFFNAIDSKMAKKHAYPHTYPQPQVITPHEAPDPKKPLAAHSLGGDR
jgi:hypothetical protein